MSEKKRTGLEIRAPKAADAFVSGAAATEARPQTPDTGHQAPAPKRRKARGAGGGAPGAAGASAVSGQKLAKGVVARADGAKRRIAAYVDVAIGDKLRRYCQDNDLEMSAVAGEAIVRFMEAEGIVPKRAR